MRLLKLHMLQEFCCLLKLLSLTQQLKVLFLQLPLNFISVI